MNLIKRKEIKDGWMDTKDLDVVHTIFGVSTGDAQTTSQYRLISLCRETGWYLNAYNKIQAENEN